MVLFNVMSLMKTAAKMELNKPTGELDKSRQGEQCGSVLRGKVESSALAMGDKARRGSHCQTLGAPGGKATCRKALEEGKTNVSCTTNKSRRRVRKDRLKNEQEAPGRVAKGSQVSLLAPGHL